MRLMRALSGAMLLALAVSAQAVVVSGSSLQDNLNAITVDPMTSMVPGTFPDVNTSQHAPDEVWELQASLASANRLLFEIAGFANQNTFGIYDVTDPSNRLELFDGAACGSTVMGCTDSLAILDGIGGNTFTNVITGVSAMFGSHRFGYYLDSSANTGGGLFFSQAALNPDEADAAHDFTHDHMIAFAGDGTIFLDINLDGIAEEFGAGEYILAWEDLAFPNSDYDYSDMVILIESVRPVPAPGTLALLSMALLGLGLRARRKVI